MEGTLQQVLDQVLAGDRTIAVLKAAFDEEKVTLASASEAADGDRGWMGALDLLKGATASEKMDDYIARGHVMKAVAEFIQKDADTRALLTPSRPQDMHHAPEKGVNPDANPQTPNMQQFMSAQKYHFKSMDMSPEYQTFMGLTPQERGRAGGAIVANATLAITKAEDYLPILKANFQTNATGALGILPTDRVAMPYNVWTGELALFNFAEEPGSAIRYTESRAISDVTQTTGDTAQRARNSALTELADEITPKSREKKSFGAIAYIALEDLRDNGRINERTNRTLDIEVKKRLAYQILNGDGTGQQWNGILNDLNSAPAANGIVDLDITHNSVPVLTTGDDREPIAFFETLAFELALRGTMAEGLLCGHNVWKVIRDSMRSAGLRNQGDDYVAMMPFGRVAGYVPMIPTRWMPANTCLIGNFSETMDVVLGPEVITGISEDYKFGDMQVSIRRAMQGNNALMQPLGMIKVTNTNNFAAATS